MPQEAYKTVVTDNDDATAPTPRPLAAVCEAATDEARPVGSLAVRVLNAALGWAGFGGGCLLWGMTVVPATVLLLPLRPGMRDTFNDVTRAGLRFYIRTLRFMRVRVEGRREHRDDGAAASHGARILVANHQSLLDPIMLMSFEPCLSGPAKDYLFRWPGLGAFLRLARFYPSKAGGRGILDTMRAGVEQAIEQGNSVLFFPEGTRSRSGEMGEFHRGAFRMAVEYGLPIQPVVIEGIHEILPPGAILVRTAERPDVRIVYLDPIDVERDPDNARTVARELAERVRSRLAAELARLREQRFGNGGTR